MKTLRIKFLQNTQECNKKGIYCSLNKYNVVEDNENYDYVFFFEYQYTNPDCMKELLNTRAEAIRIFICTEALYPDLSICDYATCFDPDYKCGDRIITQPFEIHHNSEILGIPKKDFDPREILKTKTKFCNFIYSNPFAHPMRDKIFYALSSYKKVDSIGKHLNNVQVPRLENVTSWEQESIDLKSPYKFSIASENSNMKGYTSEKIMTSMIANTIPIYFGNPDVAKLYNPKSFINASDFETLDDLVEYVKKVDNDDELWCRIMSEQWQFDEQKAEIQKQTKKCIEDFYSIFEQDIKDARRRADGYWIDRANERVLDTNSAIKLYLPEKVFSIKYTPDRVHVIITILGVKMKFRRRRHK